MLRFSHFYLQIEGTFIDAAPQNAIFRFILQLCVLHILKTFQMYNSFIKSCFLAVLTFSLNVKANFYAFKIPIWLVQRECKAQHLNLLTLQ